MVKIVNPSQKILSTFDGMEVLRRIEEIGRVSYQSEPKMIRQYETAINNEDDDEKIALLSRVRENAVDTIVTLYNRYGRNYTDDYPDRDLRDMVLDASALKFADMIAGRKHLSVFEHWSVSVDFINDRGVTHEEVRHRIASFTQESTRFCNYGNDKYGREITVIKPIFFDEDKKEDKGVLVPTITGEMKEVFSKFDVWLNCMEQCEFHYMLLTDMGCSAQEARDLLPNSLKSEIVISANLREWSDVIIPLRTGTPAHPQMKEVMIPLQADFRKRIAVIFDERLPKIEQK